MTRVRTDNVFGTITDNPLTNVATTMNSAGLANLAAVSSAEAVITLDPNRLTGAPEIVVVTAHTGSATSATIVRGQFGTAAREHAQGTEWVHGPIASNASSFVTAADDQGDYVPMNAWEAWAPTWTNLTVGNGSVIAKFSRQGRDIQYRLVFGLGSTSAIGTNPQFTLPVAPYSGAVALRDIFGIVNLRDAGATNRIGLVTWVSGSTVQLLGPNTSGEQAVLSATAPWTWTNGDSFSVVGSFEAAS